MNAYIFIHTPAVGYENKMSVITVDTLSEGPDICDVRFYVSDCSTGADTLKVIRHLPITQDVSCLTNYSACVVLIIPQLTDNLIFMN